MKITQNECIKRFIKAHGQKYDYSKVVYQGQNIDVCIICPIHGEFWMTPKRHWNGANCQECMGNKPLTTKSFIEKAKEIHKDRYDYSKVKYINNHTDVCIICPKHGEFWQTPSNHLQGYGCKYCKGEKISLKKRMKLETFIKKAKEIHKDKYDYSKVKYINNHTDVCIICPKHGEFWQTPSKHLVGHGCNKCNSSHLEEEIRHFLQNSEIEFNEQKRFKWLGRLSLDFYLPKYNIAIECQGQQHFTIKNFSGHKNTEELVNDLKIIQERDERKRKLCDENGVKLLYYSNLGIEYPYYVYEDKEELLKAINNI